MAPIPELWANESLTILEENMVATKLIHRDFSPQIASHGDAVNTHKLVAFSTKRKPQFDSPVNLWQAYKTTAQEPTPTNWI